MNSNEQFILGMRDAAIASSHPWPEYAAAEAALETAANLPGAAPHSNFGRNQGYLQGNNIFGLQQAKVPVFPTLRLLSWEWKGGQRVDLIENFVQFPDIKTSFEYRLKTLEANPSIYGDALAAKTGEDFIIQVSAAWQPAKDAGDTTDAAVHPVYEFPQGFLRFDHSRWSTGTGRALTVLQIHDQYKYLFAENEPAGPVPVAAPSKSEE